MEVKAWVEQVSIPTYGTGKPEKNPMFLEKRVYQGSSGVVYPHPVIEKIEDEKHDRAYTAVFLENEYLKIMILPELGGRIQRAYDKVKKRDFVYYNQVIKPALVGLAGPWISGGIEFNWPQHHRPSTFEPVDTRIDENADGSKTVWMGAESGSQKILDAMDKGTKVEQIYEATRLLKKHHIHVALFLQLGYLQETIDDIQLTINMVEDLLPDDLGISVSYPLPGTGFYDKVKDQLKSKSNWTDSDDLDLMFTGTYKKEFYKELQRYIHSRYRIRKLRSNLQTATGPAFRQRLRLLKSRLQCRLQKNKLRSIEPGVVIQES